MMTRVLLTIGLAVAACTPRSDPASDTQPSPPSPAKAPAPVAEATPTSARVTRARSLVEGFKGKMQGALRQALQEGTPASAIAVCSELAPKLADEAGDDALRLRRVGTRARNAERAVPTSSELEIMSQMTLIQKEHVSEEGDAFHYMQGIYIDRTLCLVCHGPPEMIPPDVKAALAEKYPDDRAIGYAMGDLRGAFVVYSAP